MRSALTTQPCNDTECTPVRRKSSSAPSELEQVSTRSRAGFDGAAMTRSTSPDPGRHSLQVSEHQPPKVSCRSVLLNQVETIPQYCKACQKLFKVLVTKYQCGLCGNYFCKDCIPKSPENTLKTSFDGRVCPSCIKIIQNPQEILESAFQKEDPELIILCVHFMQNYEDSSSASDSKGNESLMEMICMQSLQSRIKNIKTQMTEYKDGVETIDFVSDLLRASVTQVEQLLVLIERGNFYDLYERITQDSEWCLILQSARLRIAMWDYEQNKRNEHVISKIVSAVRVLHRLKIPNNPYVSLKMFEAAWIIADTKTQSQRSFVKRKKNQTTKF